MEAVNVSASDIRFDEDAADVATRARLAEAILGHLRRRPGVADTAAGIVQFWLPCIGYANAQDHIASVLEDMVARQLLEAIELPDGTLLYRRGGGFST